MTMTKVLSIIFPSWLYYVMILGAAVLFSTVADYKNKSRSVVARDVACNIDGYSTSRNNATILMNLSCGGDQRKTITNDATLIMNTLLTKVQSMRCTVYETNAVKDCKI